MSDFNITPEEESKLRERVGIEEQYQRLVNALEKGARIQMPLPKTEGQEVQIIVNEVVEIIQKSFLSTQSSYAPQDDRPFANIQDEARECGLPDEMGWLTKAIKHWTAVRNWIRYPALRSRMDAREAIEGRLIDLIVYCVLLIAMIRRGVIK